MSLINGVLRDKSRRASVHKLKVGNCLDGKSAEYLGREEMRRCIEKGKENERYAREEDERSRRSLLSVPLHQEGYDRRASSSSESSTEKIAPKVRRKEPLSASSVGPGPGQNSKPEVRRVVGERAQTETGKTKTVRNKAPPNDDGNILSYHEIDDEITQRKDTKATTRRKIVLKSASDV